MYCHTHHCHINKCSCNSEGEYSPDNLPDYAELSKEYQEFIKALNDKILSIAYDTNYLNIRSDVDGNIKEILRIDSQLLNEIIRAKTREKDIEISARNLINAETTRAIQEEQGINNNLALERTKLNNVEQGLQVLIQQEQSTRSIADTNLQNQISSIGGGKYAYLTYALMEADKVNLPANSSVDVVNDSVPENNGNYVYDGELFTKSSFNPLSNLIGDILNTFKTYDLLLNSNLVEGSFALVIGDIKKELNGLYIRDSEGFKKAPADPAALIDEKTRDYLWKKVPLKIDGSYYIGYKETTPITSTAYRTSDYIAVNKGEVYLLSSVVDFGTAAVINHFNLYDASKTFVGSLGSSRVTLQSSPSSDVLTDRHIGSYNTKSNLDNIAVIIPQSGYIKVTYKHDANKVTELVKTTYEGLVENTITAISKDNLKRFKEGLFVTPIIDNSAPNMGLDPTKIQPGSELTWANRGSVSSKPIQVKKGQYLSVQYGQAVYTNYNIWLTDINGKIIKVLDEMSEYSLVRSNSPAFQSNIKIPEDGYLRLFSKHDAATSFMYSLTDYPIEIERRYVKDSIPLNFYEASYTQILDHNLNFQSDITWSYLQNTNINLQDNVVKTGSIPYILKKGEVLTYQQDAAIDTGFFAVFTLDTPSTRGFEPSGGLHMICNEIFSLYDKGISYLQNPEAYKIFVGDAASGHVSYCNEDSDTLVVFFTPRKASSYYRIHNCTQGYNVKIQSKEEYIKERNASLTERFKQLSLLGVDVNSRFIKSMFEAGNPINYSGSYPSVLLFKGEVLQCITGSSVIPYSISLGINPTLQLNTVDKLTSIHSVYSTGFYGGTYMLPIRKEDHNSYQLTQLYARKTSSVIVSFSLLDSSLNKLDVDDLIAEQFYEPKILKLSDTVLGENLEPTLIKGRSFHLPSGVEAGRLAQMLTANDDSLLSFVPAGTYIEYNHWVSTAVNKTVLVPLDTITSTDYGGSLPNWDKWVRARVQGPKQTELNSPELVGGSNQFLHKMGYFVEKDSLVINVSETAAAKLTDYALNTYDLAAVNNLIPAVVSGEAEYYSVHKRMLASVYNHELRATSEDYFNEHYKVTSETFLNIPDLDGIEFKFCENVSRSLMYEHWSVVQICRYGKVLAVLNGLTANQGQSSARFVRTSINLEFYNDEYEEVKIKFGEYIPQEEVVLKSYLESDKGHFKDSLAAQAWHDIRTAEPFPIGGVFPPEVFMDTSKPENQMARGTTYGFPVEVYMGGAFYSLASLRNKKKRANYAMDKGNNNHILIQPDALYIGTLNWSNIQLANFEVRNPKMSGYSEGDNYLPEKYSDVEASLRRLIDWMQGVMNGDIDIKSTYQDYIDLTSFIDYGIGINLLYHWDAMVNNFLLGTHDGNIWYTYWYDGDRTWGSSGETKYSYMAITLNLYQSIFREVSKAFPEKVQARYATLRDLGVIDAKRFQDGILKMTNSIRPEARKLDAKWWGDIFEAASAPWSMQWIYHRINFLDIHYNYSNKLSDVVVQSIVDIATLEAGQEKRFIFEDTQVSLGDKLKYMFGEDLTDISVSLEVTAESEVEVVFRNTSAEAITISSSYLIIKKGV